MIRKIVLYFLVVIGGSICVPAKDSTHIQQQQQQLTHETALFQKDIDHVLYAVDQSDKRIDIFINLISGIIAVLGLIGLFGGFIIERSGRGKVKELKEELEKVRNEAKEEIKDIRSQADKAVESIRDKVEQEIKKVKNQIKDELAQIEGYRKEAKKGAEQIKRDIEETTKLMEDVGVSNEISDQLKEKVTENVEKTRKTKTEAEYTAEDWFLKGYNLQIEAKKEGISDSKEIAMLQEAAVYYQKAIEINQKLFEAYNNWGNALFKLGELKQDEALYSQSIEKFEKVIEINPNYENVYYNWGTVLSRLGELKQDEELYYQSIEKFEKAIEINQKNENAYNNWGNEKYKKAVVTNSNISEAYLNWGNVLSLLGGLKQDKKLYKESIEKYKKAIEINPKLALTYISYGYTWIKYASLNNSLDQDKEEIEALLLKAEELEKGAGA